MIEIPKENQWRPIEFDLFVAENKYGRDRGTFSPAVTWKNRVREPVGMNFEFKDLETGKVKKVPHGIILTLFPDTYRDYDKDNPTFETAEEIELWTFRPYVIWQNRNCPRKQPYVFKLASDVQFRIEDKLLQHTLKVIDTVQVGDFVKCKGTRSGDWNKVEKIMDWGIFGPKYTKPEEGYMRYTSSDNHFVKIQKIVRDGKEIL